MSTEQTPAGDARRVASLLDDFSNKTTMHGCQYVSRSSSGGLPVRLTWLGIVVAVFIANSVHLGLLINAYFQYKANVDVYFSDAKPEYPAVVICNTNPIRTSFVEDPQMVQHLRPSITLDWLFSANNRSYVRDVIGHPADYLKLYADGEELDASHWKLFLDQNYYNCYFLDNLNVTKDVKVLKILANVENKRDLRLYSQPSFHYQFYPGDGVIVALFERRIMPPRKDELLTAGNVPFVGGKFAPVGHVLKIDLTQSVRKSPGPPYVDCTKTATLDHFNYSYSQLGCLNECKAKFFIEKCSCMQERYQVPVSDETLRYCFNHRYCDVSTLPAACNQTKQTDFIRDCVEKLFCSHCKEKCTYNVYQPIYNISPVSKSYVETNIARTRMIYGCSSVGLGVTCYLRPPYEHLTIHQWAAKHMAAIEISFRDNKVEVWETKPAMTPVDLMSRIGGTMGLYLGISIVTVFEVTKLLANVCGLCFTMANHESVITDFR